MPTSLLFNTNLSQGKKEQKKKKNLIFTSIPLLLLRDLLNAMLSLTSFFFKQSETVCKLIKIKVKLIEYTILFKIFETKKY